jgi:hypothetical protein
MPQFVANQRDLLAEQLLLALARREATGRAPKRLTESNLATWREFRGNLSYNHLLALVAEDAAVRFPLPASPAMVFREPGAPGFADVPSVQVVQWMDTLTPDRLQASRTDAITDMARALGLPHRYAGANLHKLQAATRVLELPGTGGQLVARALDRSPEAALHVNCTVLTSDWADRALAGVVAMEFDAPNQAFIKHDPDLSWASSPEHRSSFDLVFALQPDKGGVFSEDQLRGRFPQATLVLV